MNKTFALLTFFFPTERSPLTDQQHVHEMGYFISSVILGSSFIMCERVKRIYLCVSREEFEALLSSFLHFFHFFLFLHFRQITHISLFYILYYITHAVFTYVFFNQAMKKAPRSTRATPSFSARSATATATALAVSLSLSMVFGKTLPTARSSPVTRSAKRSAAARNMPEVTEEALAAMVPRATPGKMKALFAKPGWY